MVSFPSERFFSLKMNKYPLEMQQDLTEFHSEKMKRVQRKLENLRKTLSGYSFNFL